jgi:hypothetical protein
MSLFSITDLGMKKADKASSGAVTASGTHVFKIGKAHQKLTEVFDTIAQDQVIPYVSLGDWSTHDLLFFLLEQTGPARVWFTTWAISEFAIRQLYQFVEHGMILQLKGIFDYRNGIRKPAELQFLQQITTEIKPAKCHAKVTVIENDSIRKPAELQFLQQITTEIKPAKCHAKVTVIENDEWGISIVGSANYTRNPRIEAGVLFTCRNVAVFERDWIERELADKSVFNATE